MGNIQISNFKQSAQIIVSIKLRALNINSQHQYLKKAIKWKGFHMKVIFTEKCPLPNHATSLHIQINTNVIN
jgi:hypothetical protein